MNTQNPNHKKPMGDDDDIVITDMEIKEVFPTEEEKEFEGKPLTEAEAEEAVGGDMPTEGITNMNIEDEEAEKEADII
jgi:hypothetical protein